MPLAVNSTAASLLGFLHAGPMTGWQLVETAQAVIGNFWSLTRSQVYRELAAMAERGLVEAGERGARDSRPYAITAAGREVFAEWLDTMPARESIRFPLLLTIVFGRHLAPERLTEIVAAHRGQHAEQLRGYEAARAAAVTAGYDDPFALATLEFGMAYERAALAWFDALPAEVRGRGDREASPA